MFEQLDITWPKNKKQFVDNDDTNEATPYLQVNFFYGFYINNDGVEKVFIVPVNVALFEKTGAGLNLYW